MKQRVAPDARETVGLTRLDQVVLSPEARQMLDAAVPTAGGPAGWRQRKAAEAHQLLALVQRAGPSRMAVHQLNLREELRAVYELKVPVPMKPGPDGKLVTAQRAVLGLVYPQGALAVPLPGYTLVCLLHPPFGVWHPNIGRGHGQPLCFGPRVPAGIPVTELALLSYSLLCLQSVMLDPGDSAGVMCRDAAEWWQANPGLRPLTKEPFFVAPKRPQVEGSRC